MKFKISDKAKSVITTVAPTLGAALGGPLGALAGNVLAAAVGGNNAAAVEEALLTQKPETLLALRKAEQEFQLKLAELDVDLERLAVTDRGSARDLAKINMRPQLWISALFLGGYFGVLIMRMAGVLEPDASDKEIINTLMSVLTTGVPLILMFWFGSTAGSAVKSSLLAQSKPADS